MTKHITHIALFSSIAIVAALLWFGSQNIAAESTILADQQLPGLHYVIMSGEEQSAIIQVEYDTKSADGILQYKDTVAQLSREYALAHPDTSFIVDVTFKRPMSIEDFRTLNSNYRAKPVDFALRTVASDGERGTISGAAEKAGDISTEAVDRIFNSVQENQKGVTLKGVVSFRANITGATYDALSSDGNIFLVDALQPYLTDETVRLKPSVAPSEVDYHTPNPYWFMEEVGLIQ